MILRWNKRCVGSKGKMLMKNVQVFNWFPYKNPSHIAYPPLSIYVCIRTAWDSLLVNTVMSPFYCGARNEYTRIILIFLLFCRSTSTFSIVPQKLISLPSSNTPHFTCYMYVDWEIKIKQKCLKKIYIKAHMTPKRQIK